VEALGGVASHLAAFATLHLLAELQDFGLTFEAALPFLTYLLLACSLIGTQMIRYKIVAADGKFDTTEKEWYNEGNAAELEAWSLVVSFIASQALRCFIGNSCPDSWGTEHNDNDHTWLSCFLLFTVGALSLVGAVLAALRGISGSESAEAGHAPIAQPSFTRSLLLEKLRSLLLDTLIFIAGWCFLITTVWILQRTFYHDHEDSLMPRRVWTSLICTGTTFLIVLVLDRSWTSRRSGWTPEWVCFSRRPLAIPRRPGNEWTKWGTL
jgi:hypothetical protein